jgi:hypothetical protein
MLTFRPLPAELRTWPKAISALPCRWCHVQGVARRAAVVAPLIGNQSSALVCSAWLHDTGYAPPLAALGVSPP